MRSVLGSVLAVLASGCVIDSVPLPDWGRDDSGKFDERDTAAGDGGNDATQSAHALRLERMFYAETSNANELLLVGTPGATLGGGTLIVTNDTADPFWQGHAAPLRDGSFSLPIRAHFDDQIALYYELDDWVYDRRVLQLRPASVDARSANLALSANEFETADPNSLDDLPPVTTAGVVVFPPIDNTVVVVGGPGTLSHGMTVVIANIDTGGATSVDVAWDGGFTAMLEGSGGDELHLFAVERVASNGGGDVLITGVPEGSGS